MRFSSPFLSIALLCVAPAASAQIDRSASAAQGNSVYELDSGEIVASDATGTYVYDSWDEYLRSSFFVRHGKHCGFDLQNHPPQMAFLGSQGDCTNSFSIPAAEYDPTGGGATVYDIPVVFHVLYNNNGSGNIPDQRIFEQIDILNDDFAMLTNSKVQFHLATVDPSGNPTTGITRTRNRQYYNDRGSYASALGWDTNRYLNIYTNTAGGNLGYAYVPNGGGVVGQSFDGVRILWNTVGITTSVPYNLGRTGTHEVGHYLGLLHTFNGGCGTSNCNGSGDLICDTNAESSPNYNACSPSERSTCGSPDPVRNYMDYSEDACMDHFTLEQAYRMRCTLENWRVDLANWDGGGTGGNPPAAATGPSPANGAGGASISTGLSWSAASGATQYDVYFGTSTSPGLVSADQGGTSYSPGTLSYSTTYYWRVDSENNDGTTTGTLWSFTTEDDPGPGGGPIFFDGFESGAFGGWSSSSNDARISTNAATGTFAAELRRSSSISQTISTGAASSVTVSWDWRTSGYDAGEVITCTVTGGSGGSVSFVSSGNQYTSGSLAVSGLSGSLTITFSGGANRKNERGYVDNVEVR